MARLEVLIGEIPSSPLRDEIAQEVSKLKARKVFGLVVEEHLPELVQLSNLPVKRGPSSMSSSLVQPQQLEMCEPAACGKVRGLQGVLEALR